MSAQYISLATVARQLEIYEQVPVRIQKGLENSIWITLLTNLICIPLLIFVPPLLGYVETGTFFGVIEPTAVAANILIGWIHQLSGLLLILNIVSFVLTLIILLLSQGMTEAVQEPVHWMAWGAAFPSGISALSIITIIILFVLLFVITLIIWIVGIMLAAVFLRLFFGK